MVLLVLNSNIWKYLTVCKQMILRQKKLFELDRNKWNHLTVCKKKKKKKLRLV